MHNHHIIFVVHVCYSACHQWINISQTVKHVKGWSATEKNHLSPVCTCISKSLYGVICKFVSQVCGFVTVICNYSQYMLGHNTLQIHPFIVLKL